MMNVGLRMLRTASLAGAGMLLAMSLAASPASAQAEQGGTHACQGDAFRLCNEFIPDRGKVASCLFKNKRKLSAACRVVMGGGKASVSRKAKGKRYGKRKRSRR